MKDIITKDGIIKNLTINKEININVFNTVNSTNTFLKENSKKYADGTIIVANEQSEGRGRLGRKFFSPQNTGVYFSLLLKPEFDISNINMITPIAAVAMCKAIECATEKKPMIKWVNDIYLDNRKICGILAESLKIEDELYIILGVGVNVYNPKNGFDDEIKDIAGYLSSNEEIGLKNKICAQFLNCFYKYYDDISNESIANEYRKRCFILGKEVDLITTDGIKKVKVIDINNDCNLLVQYKNGNEEYIISGEVSIKVK